MCVFQRFFDYFRVQFQNIVTHQSRKLSVHRYKNIPVQRNESTITNAAENDDNVKEYKYIPDSHGKLYYKYL